MAVDLPPSIGYLAQKATWMGGSEIYRLHRPAMILGQKDNWLTFVTHTFHVPEKPEPFVLQVFSEGGEELAICPKVIITRPLWRMEDDESEGFDAAETMRQSIAYAQEAGQLVLIDIDDHPYGWNAEFALREQTSPITDWAWHDNYIRQANAVLCSTRFLVNVMADRIPDQTFAWAPNLYDPWRYQVHERPLNKVLGAHLYCKARFRDDFTRLGEVLGPIMEADPELVFHHIGEEFPCAHCGHHRLRHFEEQVRGETEPVRLECEECACEVYVAGRADQLAQVSGLPAERIVPMPHCNLTDLPQRMDWNVGVIPLADNEWNYAKTEGKGFEMAAAGIPFVALTGLHALYIDSPANHLMFGLGNGSPAERIAGLTQREDTYRYAQQRFRTWAQGLAQRHENHYRKALQELSRQDLSKTLAH